MEATIYGLGLRDINPNHKESAGKELGHEMETGSRRLSGLL